MHCEWTIVGDWFVRRVLLRFTWARYARKHFFPLRIFFKPEDCCCSTFQVLEWLGESQRMSWKNMNLKCQNLSFCLFQSRESLCGTSFDWWIASWTANLSCYDGKQFLQNYFESHCLHFEVLAENPENCPCLITSAGMVNKLFASLELAP